MPVRRLALAACLLAVAFAAVPRAQQSITLEPRLGLPPASFRHTPTMAQFLSPGYPEELESARKADRVAWLAFESGKRDVYTAAAPDFKAVRLTNFKRDEGDVLTNTQISDDGTIIAFVHGGAPNRDGWIANPTASPQATERAIWAVRSSGGAPWRVAEGGNPALSPDGRWVLFVKDGQIFRAAVTPTAQTPVTNDPDKGLKPFVKEWGVQSNPSWAPDGSKIAFVSTRTDHSFIMVYDVKSKSVVYVSPSVDFDTSPTWSEDGKQIAFIRRPGLPFGQQAQQGNGSLGNPNGPALGRGGSGGRGGRGGGGGRGRGAVDESQAADPRKGLFTATFENGSTTEIWHNQPNDKAFTSINTIAWAGDAIVFAQEPEEWARWYSVSTRGGTFQPTELTPGAGQVEYVSIAKDGRTLFYSTNAGDIDRRHVWRVPTSGGKAEQVTMGDGIETMPAALASGTHVAVLSADALRPFGVGVWPSGAAQAKSAQKVIYPTLAADFPMNAEVATIKSSFRRICGQASGVRRSCSCTAGRCARCSSAITTCGSITRRTRRISGSRAWATS